jgi:hypothetical protein
MTTNDEPQKEPLVLPLLWMPKNLQPGAWSCPNPKMRLAFHDFR